MQEKTINEMTMQPRDYSPAFAAWQQSARNVIYRPDHFEDPLFGIIEGRLAGTPCAFDQRLAFREGEVTMWAGQNGNGKALDLNTPIPTTEGWKKMGDVHPGDYVFDENGKPCRVVAETEIQYNRPCYLVGFNDGTEIVADAEHEWLTDDYKSRQSRSHAKQKNRLELRPVKKFGTDQTHKRTFASIRTTHEIADTLLFSNNSQKNKTNHSINVCQPVKYLEQDLPIPPYTLGAWLGDGTSGCGEITTPDQHILDRIRADGYEITEHKDKLSYGILGLQVQLREHGLLNNKHVPAIYLKASLQQRLALLQGLMDTDGHCSQHTCEFCSTNRQLAEAVHELAASLGCIVHLIEGRAKLYGKDCGEKFRVTFTTAVEVFSLPRKKERLPKDVTFRAKQRFIVKCELCESVPVKCIQVDSPSHLYLASKAFVPTHNSLLTGQVALQLLAAGQKVGIQSFEMTPARTLYRMLRQGWGRLPTKYDAQANEKKIQAFLAYCRDAGLLLSNEKQAITIEGVLGVSVVMAKEFGCKHVFIDNLMKVVHAEDDYTGQKEFVQGCCQIARELSVHIHIVHHVRKGGSEKDEIDKFAVRGSSAIVDQIDNLVLIRRNLDKERLAEQRELTPTEDQDEADSLLRISKQRNGDFMGLVPLWFDKRGAVFCTSAERALPRLLPEYALPADCLDGREL